MTTTSARSFTDHLRETAAPVHEAMYLADFARALAVTGSRADTPETVLEFLHFAEGAIVVERGLHERYFEDFSAAVERAIVATEQAATHASDRGRSRMVDAFVTSARLEWMFWDSAHRLETWPP